MDEAISIGKLANLAVALTVVFIGSVWLRAPSNGRQGKLGLSFRFRAFRFWWAAWFLWVVAWVAIALKPDSSSKSEKVSDLWILIPDNINSLLLLLAYFSLTRGDSYKTREAVLDGLKIGTALAFGYSTIYGAILIAYGSNGLPTAIKLHAQWSLCMSVAVVILIGWACRIRFNTRYALGASFLYAFAQPAAYDAALEQSGLRDVYPMILILLALLKAVWAVVFVRVLYSGKSGGNSLVEIGEQANIKLWSGWPPAVARFAACLFLVSVSFLTYFAVQNSRVSEILTVVGLVGGLAAVLGAVWKLADFLQREGQ